MKIGGATAIFRIFDVDKAMAFYCDWLGFEKLWEFRFNDDSPVYMGIKLGETNLHLSEHHGDCTPGSSIRIQVDGIHDYHALIANKPYRFYNPSVEETQWDTLDMQVMDPFGNKIIFWEEAAEK